MFLRIQKLTEILRPILVEHFALPSQPPILKITLIPEHFVTWGKSEYPFAVFLVFLPFTFVGAAVVDDDSAQTMPLPPVPTPLINITIPRRQLPQPRPSPMFLLTRPLP